MKSFAAIVCFALSPFLIVGCASTPPALVPSADYVQGLAVIPQTETAQTALGRKQPLIIQDFARQKELFNVLEMNKGDASTSGMDVTSHDFVVKWKLRNEEEMDRSKLYLRMNSPRTFVYESDLGGSTKKYVIKVTEEDARIVWNAIGISLN